MDDPRPTASVSAREDALLNEWFNQLDAPEALPEDPWALLEGLQLTPIDASKIIKEIEEESTEEDEEGEGTEDSGMTLPAITLPGTLRGSRDRMIEYLFETDLQRRLAKLIKLRIQDACGANTPWETRRDAIRWIFCSTDDSMDQNARLSLRDALAVFGARHHVLQARVVYQLYINALPLRSPLPFLADGLPEIIENELWGVFGAHNGYNAVTLARVAWLWPGMRIDLFRSECQKSFLSGPDVLPFEDLLDKMLDAGYLGVAAGFVFAICRNPSKQQKKNGSMYNIYSWSSVL